MDKKTINIIIIVAVILAAGAVVALKVTASKDQAGQKQNANEADKKLPKIIKISNMQKKATPCSPCGKLERVLAQVQREYADKMLVESHYLSESAGKAFIKKYRIDESTFVPALGAPVQVFFVDAEGKLSETVLDWNANKEQIIDALKEVGVE